MSTVVYSESQDRYENALYAFFELLQCVASPPDEACTRRGNFNVAGEFWLEIQGYGGLLKRIETTPKQAEIDAIRELLATVAAVPPEASGYVEGRAQCIAQLSHPAWERPRQLAQFLLVNLRGTIAANKRYIESERPEY